MECAKVMRKVRKELALCEKWKEGEQAWNLEEVRLEKQVVVRVCRNL